MKQLEAVKPTLPMSEYRAHPAVSKSDLDLIHRSPAHYREAQLNPKPPTGPMIWGSMFHAFVLEPEVFSATYAVLTAPIDKRTTAGKEAWAAWQEENPGKVVVEKPILSQLEGMRDAICANPFACAALTGGVAETSIFWTHESGVQCKCRPDYINRGSIWDLKTSEDAQYEAFRRSCWNYRYHVQAAHYGDGYLSAFGEPPEAFVFVVVEKDPPYGVRLYEADEMMVDQGRHEALVDLETYAECAANNVWPCYPTPILPIELPYWAQEQRQ